MLRGDDDVAREDQLEPARHRRPVHGRDNWLGEEAEQQRVDAGLVARGRVVAASCRLREVFEVHAGAERAVARTGEDDGPHCVVVLGLGERLADAADRGHVEGVAALRSIQRDDQHLTAHLTIDRHARPP